MSPLWKTTLTLLPSTLPPSPSHLPAPRPKEGQGWDSSSVCPPCPVHVFLLITVLIYIIQLILRCWVQEI